MKKGTMLSALLTGMLALLLVGMAASTAEGEYAGEWRCTAIDPGDGVLLEAYEGMKAEDLMTLRLMADGSLEIISFGQTIPGSWTESPGGVAALVEGTEVFFEKSGDKLIAQSDGVLMYLEKEVENKQETVTPQPGGLLSLLRTGRFAGNWVAVSVDQGDGIIRTEVDGVPISRFMSFQINGDGTLVLRSIGVETPGTWREAGEGIEVLLKGTSTLMLPEDGALVAETEGWTIRFQKAEEIETEEPSEPAERGLEGTWKAVRVETFGQIMDAALMFPDGCTLTLSPDGTGSASVTKDYAERFAWSEKDGEMNLSGSYIFSSPVWDAQKQELRLGYAMGTVTIVFVRENAHPSEAVQPVQEPPQTPAPPPSVEPEEPAMEEPPQTAVPLPSYEPEEPAVEEPPLSSPPVTWEPLAVEGWQRMETKLFSLYVPEEWILAEGTLYEREDYCSAKYLLPDQGGWYLASAQLSVTDEPAERHRERLRRLLERAEKEGRDSLDEFSIGGMVFQGMEYENWGAVNAEYIARAAESRVTLVIQLEHLENFPEYSSLLSSVAYTLPVLTPPNVDPPLPEDGVPYRPETASVQTDAVRFNARWLPSVDSIVLDDIFGNQIAILDGRLYVLTGKILREFSLGEGVLTPEGPYGFPGRKLDDRFEYLSASRDGFLYVSEGLFSILALRNDQIVADNSLSGKLAMHPSGEWGISFWGDSDPKKVSAVDGTLSAEPWVLSGLRNEGERRGRFGTISLVYLSQERIYVAGRDETHGGTHRVAVFDLEGNELTSFGTNEWLAGDAFGSVTGIAETKDGILVLDGNFRELKLFSHDGTFVANVACDDLLGTDYPWPSSMTAVSDGVLIAAAQKRQDESCSELLIFEVTLH